MSIFTNAKFMLVALLGLMVLLASPSQAMAEKNGELRGKSVTRGESVPEFMQRNLQSRYCRAFPCMCGLCAQQQESNDETASKQPIEEAASKQPIEEAASKQPIEASKQVNEEAASKQPIEEAATKSAEPVMSPKTSIFD